eukprot:s470_g16.t3
MVASVAQIPNDDLVMLSDVLTLKPKNKEETGKKLTVEERVAKGLYHLVPALALLSDAEIAVKNAKNEAHHKLMEMVLTEYSTYSDGAMTTNLSPFVQLVKDELRRRNVPSVEIPEGNACILQ